MAKALQGDVRATTALLALYARVISEPPEDEGGSVEEHELLILRRFGPGLLKSLTKKAAKNDDRSGTRLMLCIAPTSGHLPMRPSRP